MRICRKCNGDGLADDRPQVTEVLLGKSVDEGEHFAWATLGHESAQAANPAPPSLDLLGVSL